MKFFNHEKNKLLKRIGQKKIGKAFSKQNFHKFQHNHFLKIIGIFKNVNKWMKKIKILHWMWCSFQYHQMKSF